MTKMEFEQKIITIANVNGDYVSPSQDSVVLDGVFTFEQLKRMVEVWEEYTHDHQRR